MDWGAFSQALAESSAARDAYVASLPGWVRLWMTWMSLVLALSIVFAWKKPEARWILAMIVVLLPLTR
jgi:hypothetical protein